jgi:hypothetical protein
MKSIVIALFATLLVTGCLFSKKEEAPAEAPAMEEAAPTEAAPTAEEVPATEPAPAE